MKLLESTILYVLKGEHNNKHSRQQLGMNNRRNWGHTMEGETGIMCVAMHIHRALGLIKQTLG